ncbi:putative nucleic acid-binding protein [Lewinella aquimaris]|uniref:Putative nucleic acid-binding protein n=1 Tax=Neolewinella aquimaris TaxID=1835722 RepID=A0A840EDL8_9BACT|nr:putative nucleic acid-binding protein [Neolewinella aquimaris]
MMDVLFVDTNVILDWLADRAPFSEAATQLFELAEKKEVVLVASSTSFIVSEYVLRKHLSKAKTLRVLHILRSVTRIANTGERQLDMALGSGWNDFEDAFQEACARLAGASTIITRNAKDFSQSTCAVMSPHEYLYSR